MGWSARIAIPFLLFAVNTVTELTSALADANTPWESPQTMSRYMSGFLRSVEEQGVFSGDQLGDMKAIPDTLKQRMTSSDKRSRFMPAALNMEFASSVADIMAEEQGGASLSEEKSAVDQALTQAFVQTTGTINTAFVTEIEQLIEILSNSRGR